MASLSLTGARMTRQPSSAVPSADLGAESLQIRREAIYLVLAQVPEGCVVSYGELAQMAGLGRGARLVGRVLSQLPEGSRLPWHRVIAAGGRISLPLGSPGGDEQRARLRAEGVRIHNDRVDIRRHGWLSAGQSE
ncbi:MAG: DNA base-flipping protein [Pseudomonas delhiensis]|nr:MAG: DNA base-flipping protein [Pseudomonas delhiensis]